MGLMETRNFGEPYKFILRWITSVMFRHWGHDGPYNINNNNNNNDKQITKQAKNLLFIYTL